MAREDIYLQLSMGWGSVFSPNLGAKTSEGLALEYQNINLTILSFQAAKKKKNAECLQSTIPQKSSKLVLHKQVECEDTGVYGF